MPANPSPMRRAGIRTMLLAVVLTGWFPVLRGDEPAGFDRSHGAWAAVLGTAVRDGRVDYPQLHRDPAALDQYLATLAAVDAADFARWPREDRLALLINLYNAATVRLIVDHHPVDSIRDIGLLPGAAWRREVVRFGGRTLSLDALEHGILRKDYREPRIHFALVCAALGCPPLRAEPYVGSRLDAQLDDQARTFLSDPLKNRFEPAAGTLWLSPIFDWYRDDFGGTPAALAAYVRPYLTEADRRAWPDAGTLRVRFTDYDWRLNITPPAANASP